MATFIDLMNAQVANEFAASQQYVAIAVYYDGETLPQLASLFYRQAMEERTHAMMLVQYLIDADGPVVIPGVAAPKTAFVDAIEPVVLALAQERTVTAQISALAAAARAENDLVGEQFMAWFLKEQLEEMSSMSALLKTVERASASNLLLVEEYLARTSAGGDGDGEDSSAPRAAGGAA